VAIKKGTDKHGDGICPTIGGAPSGLTDQHALHQVTASSGRAESRAVYVPSHVTIGLLVSCLATVSARAGAEEPSESCAECRATGDSCFLGIDPDVYQMPLPGEYIQSGERLICATQNWSMFPAEVFDIDFLRTFWGSLSPENQARTEAAAYYFVTTHWGPPTAPALDLAEVATPQDFAGEAFASLAARTTRIEFEVPKTDFERLGWQSIHLPLSIAPAAAPSVPLKLRGWYIRGDGVVPDRVVRRALGRPSSRQHPLLLLSSGFPYSIAYDERVGGIEVGKQARKAMTYFVAKGFDVLVFDKRGHGYSEGLLDGMGEDVFRALDQLEQGVIVEAGVPLTLSIITEDGRRRSGRAAARERLLGNGYSARTKPIVLRGFSYGASQLQKAMAMNYTELPVEYRFQRDATGAVVVDPTRAPRGNRGYDFRGIVAISGFQGSIKYETTPFFLALDAMASSGGHNGAVLKSSVYQSMDRWPAFLGLYATNDFETADGAIEAYNQRLRGVKDIRMVTGYHFGLASAEVDTYFARETAAFAEQILFHPRVVANTQTTTYARAVCDAEQVTMDPVTQSIVDVPSETIRSANDEVDQFIRGWIERETEKHARP
jgi:pimeloyl-ACP methyl ester carboxylesterase